MQYVCSSGLNDPFAAVARLCSSKQWSLGILEMGARKRDVFYPLKESECLFLKLPQSTHPAWEAAIGFSFQLTGFLCSMFAAAVSTILCCCSKALQLQTMELGYLRNGSEEKRCIWYIYIYQSYVFFLVSFNVLSLIFQKFQAPQLAASHRRRRTEFLLSEILLYRLISVQ